MAVAERITSIDSTAPSMQEIDPSPVESPIVDASNPEKHAESGAYFPSARSSTSTTLGLHPTTMSNTLLTLQKYSVIPPSLYLLGHYTSTALVPLFTQDTHSAERTLLLMRPYYQSWPLEPLLIFAPIATHVLSGIALRIHRRRISAKRHGGDTFAERRKIAWPKVSLTSALGFALYPMLAAHVIVNRVTPLKVEGGSSGVGLRYFAHGIAKHPVMSNIAYALMVSVASWHFVGGAAKFLQVSRDYVRGVGEEGRRKRQRRAWLVNGISALVAAGWIAGGLGVIGRTGAGTGWEAKNWDLILKQVPLLGPYM
jgi:Protein of unknown function (DUF1691)